MTIISSKHCGWWHLLMGHHPATLSRHMYRVSGNVTSHICHVTSSDHPIEKTCKLGELFVSVKFGGRWSHGNGDMTFFLCHVTWLVHVIKVFCDFVDRFFSSEYIFLSSLVTPRGSTNVTFFRCQVITWGRDQRSHDFVGDGPSR